MSVNVSLQPLDPLTARDLSVTLASMDPWRTLRTGARALGRHLLEPDEHLRQRTICLKKECVGVVVIRSPWLYGPYVTLLALLPGYQGRGIGSAVLRRVEKDARPRARNIWACVSSFNRDARRFYEQNGFEHAGTLPELLRPEFTELLLRKRLR